MSRPLSSRKVTPRTSPAAELRRRAEALLPKRRGDSPAEDPATLRIHHELEVHQIELEMQNAELQKIRDELELTLEKYTDLYDFSPVGYLSIDEQGEILDANLTGTALLGIERSALLKRRILPFIAPESRPIFQGFIKDVFTRPGDHTCEVIAVKRSGDTFWAGFQGTSAWGGDGTTKWGRVAFTDISLRKEAEESIARMGIMSVANQNLKREIERRQVVEEALRASEKRSRELLRQSQHMQERLSLLSRRVLTVQEEERRKISRELHDVIAQVLASINVRLALLKKDAAVRTRGLSRKISHAQKLVEKSVDIVHRFARDLRPTVLDDLGLAPALHALVKSFTHETGTRVTVNVPGGLNRLSNAQRTTFYRVAQEALTNVTRHAQADRVEVSVQKTRDGVVLEIRDNGKSFDVKGLWHSRKRQHLGLLGMRERMQMVGGEFTIASAPGRGTTVQARIPLHPARRGAVPRTPHRPARKGS